MNWKSYLAYKKRRFADDRKIRICRATSKVCTSKVRIDVKKLYKVLIALSKYRLNKVDRMVKNMIKLGDVATYINGYAFKPKDRSKRGLPIIRIQDLTGNSYDLGFYDGTYPQKIEINDGDVLISWSASLGVYIWNRGKALLNQHIFKVEFDKADIDKNYFVFAVRHKLKEMGRKTHGATMKHIVKKDFESTEIPYPSYEKQVEIATNLNKIFRIIESRNKELQLLDELIKARFVKMFGSIHESTKYPYIAVKDLTNVISGGTPSRDRTEYWNNGTIPWVKTTELQNNVIKNVDEHITESGLAGSSAKLVPIGTVLVAMYGQGKTRGMTAYLGIEASTNQACACILPSEKIDSMFMWKYFELSYDKLRSLAQGAGQPNLNGNMIKNFKVLVPPIELQNEYVAFVEQVDKSKSAIEKELKKTQILFDSLMQKYFG
ncbi:restriction endonuclease subunit S [Roseburia sp. AM59-24XD]|uniref:restriction endonuclease subunit S n=1 Tax=Roseburia sp. AM59-24XD TaxID=2293138 RepID=UPI001FA946FC|nr:restriction endonuclease subunit S [Roseburia sp. AM59-24XD]